MQSRQQQKETKTHSKYNHHSASFPFGHPNHGETNSHKIRNKEESYIELNARLDATNIQLFQKNRKQSRHTYPIFSLLPKPTKNKQLKLSDITEQLLLQSNFPILVHSIRELIECSVRILRTSQFCRLHFTDKLVRRMVTLIANNYEAVSYHNFSHAFSLMLLNFQCINKQFSLKYMYTEEQYFYILLAGLAHDLRHRGTNNQFQIKTKSALAEQSQNRSVLQNMHIRQFWTLLQQNQQLNPLLVSKDQSKAKHIMTRLILNTDMAFHFKNVEALQTLRKNNQLDPKHNNQHKWFLMEQIFHACDIGNSCAEYDNYIGWSALLSYEFNEQAKMEQTMGLEVTKCFIFNDMLSFYKDQVWFIGNMVQPLWKQITLQLTDLAYLSDNIQNNLKIVTKQLEKLRL